MAMLMTSIYIEPLNIIKISWPLMCRGVCRGWMMGCQNTPQLAVKDGMSKLTSARAVLAKCTKLSNIVHQSALFKESFEARFGTLRSIPEANATRRSSMYHQLSAIVQLDQKLLRELLNETNHINLVLTQGEAENLEELVTILAPFAEVTDIIQGDGDKFPTLGGVVPTVVSLHKILNVSCEKAQFHQVFARALLDSLVTRFTGLLDAIRIITPGPQV